jgi:transposase-like protein
VTVAEIARTFDIPAANIRQWVKRGKVTKLPCGTVDLHSLARWLDRNLDAGTYWRIDKAA